MGWLRDYGAFIAATVAAVATLGNAWLQARRDAKRRDEEWLRDLRLPRCLAFLTAAADYHRSVTMELGYWDIETMGPAPASEPATVTKKAFEQALNDVLLVGPADLAKAAKLVGYGIQAYVAQLEADPDLIRDVPPHNVVGDFLSAAQKAVGIPPEATRVVGYQEWVKAMKAVAAHGT